MCNMLILSTNEPKNHLSLHLKVSTATISFPCDATGKEDKYYLSPEGKLLRSNVEVSATSCQQHVFFKRRLYKKTFSSCNCREFKCTSNV